LYERRAPASVRALRQNFVLSDLRDTTRAPPSLACAYAVYARLRL
jgi:hypothetical protein